MGDEPCTRASRLTNAYSEEALTFDCQGESLVGVLSRPASPGRRGVLIVVGGPQYRVGSHRQFTLLARHLAQNNIAALRFDYRGMGDSTGEARTFESIGKDIRCAIDVFLRCLPTVKEVVIWGLCDAASAALLYAHCDARITGLVLANPWVRTAQGIARTQLRHYYSARLLDRSFWRKAFRGGLELRASARSLAASVSGALSRRKRIESTALLPDRMRESLRSYSGSVLLILSGNDLTAQEFKDLVAGSADWQALLRQQRIGRCNLSEANHTFSAREWRNQIAAWTCEWVKHLG